MNRAKELGRKIDITFRKYPIYGWICCLEVIVVVTGMCMMYSLPAITGLLLRQIDKHRNRGSAD